MTTVEADAIPDVATASGATLSPLLFVERPGLPLLLLKNLGLTIVTFGVYWFWARTAVRRHWWNSIVIDGDPLEYTGTGTELFRGFLSGAAYVLPAFLLLAVLRALAVPAVWQLGADLVCYLFLLLVFVPVAMFRARRYWMSRTRWRDIRAGMNGTPERFLGITLRGFGVTVLTLGVLAPWMRINQTRYILQSSRLGDQRLSFDGKVSDLILPWLAALALPVGLLLLLTRLFGFFPITFAVVLFTPGILAYTAYEFRYMLNHTLIGPMRIHSELEPIEFAFYAFAFCFVAGVTFGIVSGIAAISGVGPEDLWAQGSAAAKSAVFVVFAIGLYGLFLGATSLLRVLFVDKTILRTIVESAALAGLEELDGIAPEPMPARDESRPVPSVWARDGSVREGWLYDGIDARHDVTMQLDQAGRSLIIVGAGGELERWPFSKIRLVEPPLAGFTVRYRRSDRAWPRLSSSYDSLGWLEPLCEDLHEPPPPPAPPPQPMPFWTVPAVLILLVGLVIMCPPFFAHDVAAAFPPGVEQRVGLAMDETVRGVLGYGQAVRQCQAPAGQAALDQLAARLAKAAGLPNPPVVEVLDTPASHALALPGNRVLVSRGLLDAAPDGNALAGVLAYEFGDIARHHPLETAVRKATPSLLGELLMGEVTGTWSAGGTAPALLNAVSSGQAERDADAAAAKILTTAGIDPAGLANFFQVLGQEPPKSGPSFATSHPDPGGRDAMLRQAGPAGSQAVPDADWKQIKAICAVS